MSSIYIFNQYYIDLIKKLKVIAKKHKDTSNTAKKVLNSIKNNYSTLDKSSDEYIKFLVSNINSAYNFGPNNSPSIRFLNASLLNFLHAFLKPLNDPK
jgi:hypothetical protein